MTPLPGHFAGRVVRICGVSLREVSKGCASGNLAPFGSLQRRGDAARKLPDPNPPCVGSSILGGRHDRGDRADDRASTLADPTKALAHVPELARRPLCPLAG